MAARFGELIFRSLPFNDGGKSPVPKLHPNCIRDYTSRGAESDFGLADVEEVSFAALDKELRFYLERSRPTYARMPEMQKPVSDLVVNGTKTPDEIIDEILKKIGLR